MVITRYAPSPTGLQHIGNLRTALFSYLFAKINNGKFLLRIEDTDRQRYSYGAVLDILNNIRILKIPHEPDILIQSNRLKEYKKASEKLIKMGFAYRCNCSKERINRLSEYDKRCRKLKIPEDVPHVVRLSIPEDFSDYSFDDLLLGKIKNIQPPVDPILMKSDGYPTYHLASVVDDAFSKVTHIFRSSEWLPSTPIHLFLHYCLNNNVTPRFCHLPTINGDDGSKLSKRHGAVSVYDLLNEYEPEALINYMVLLGWSPKNDEEIFSLKELEKLFSIKGLNKSSAIFDEKKLKWFNKQHIMRLSIDEFKKRLKEKKIKPIEEILYPLLQLRLNKIRRSDIAFWIKPIVKRSNSFFLPKKTKKEDVKRILDFFINNEKYIFSNEEKMRALAVSLRISFGKLMSILRVAITGRNVSLPILDIIELLKKDEIFIRLKNFKRRSQQ